jgi:hypothetical protein
MVILSNLCKTGSVLVKGVVCNTSCIRLSLSITKSEEVASLCKWYARNQQNSVKGINKIGNKVPKLRIVFFFIFIRTNYSCQFNMLLYDPLKAVIQA